MSSAVTAAPVMVPPHWRAVELGDYAEVTKGVSYKGAHLNEPGPLLLGLGEFIPGGGVKLGAARTYGGEYRERHVARPGDILVALTDLTQSGAVLGSPLIVPSDIGAFCLYTHHVGRIAIREPKSIDASFLRYVLQDSAFSVFVSGRATGTTVRAVHAREVAQFEFALPPLDQQRSIARVLGALDDKIELNRRMSKTLEEMAQALFRSWFVDFDPVRAKAEGRPSGLPPDLDALFPTSFEVSEVGEMPVGWKVQRLGDLVEVTRGLSYKGAGLSADGIPMHNLNSIHEGGGYKHDGIKHYAGDYKSQHILSPGDVIVANTEQGHDRRLIGHAAVVPRTMGAKGLFSHHLYRIRSAESKSMPADFLCELLNNPVMHHTVSGYANGTTVNMLPVDAVRLPSIVVPPTPLRVLFGDRAATIRRRREQLVEHSTALAMMRDTILPRLVSGEVRVAGT